MLHTIKSPVTDLFSTPPATTTTFEPSYMGPTSGASLSHQFRVSSASKRLPGYVYFGNQVGEGLYLRSLLSVYQSDCVVDLKTATAALTEGLCQGIQLR